MAGSNAPDAALHLATVAHDGFLWDVHMEFESDPMRPRDHRAALRFTSAGNADAPTVTRTTVIIIEESYEQAVAKARSFDDRQLTSLLRSTLPTPE